MTKPKTKKAAPKKAAKKAAPKKVVKKSAPKKEASKKELPTVKESATEACLIDTNKLLKKIQHYFYFSGDNYAMDKAKANAPILEKAKKGQVLDLLKNSTDALLLIQKKGYAFNDFFLNDIIRENDKFLSQK